jgi:hypothetical protein
MLNIFRGVVLILGSLAGGACIDSECGSQTFDGSYRSYAVSFDGVASAGSAVGVGSRFFSVGGPKTLTVTGNTIAIVYSSDGRVVRETWRVR